MRRGVPRRQEASSRSSRAAGARPAARSSRSMGGGASARASSSCTFFASRPAMYRVGKVAPAELQLRETLDEAARALAQPLLAQVVATTWRAALEAMAESGVEGAGEAVSSHSTSSRWTAGASPELPSVLQELWDRRWKRGRVMLILCGSMIGFMEREVLGAKSPLLGGAPRKSGSRRSDCGRPQRFIRDGRAPTRRACALSSAESRATCARSSLAARSSRTSPTTCSPSSHRCSASPNSCSARSSRGQQLPGGAECDRNRRDDDPGHRARGRSPGARAHVLPRPAPGARLRRTSISADRPARQSAPDPVRPGRSAAQILVSLRVSPSQRGPAARPEPRARRAHQARARRVLRDLLRAHVPRGARRALRLRRRRGLRDRRVLGPRRADRRRRDARRWLDRPRRVQVGPSARFPDGDRAGAKGGHGIRTRAARRSAGDLVHRLPAASARAKVSGITWHSLDDLYGA